MSGLDAHVVVDGDFGVDAHVRVADGERLALLGPNGAGKTTIVEAIAGVRPSASTIRLGGRSIGGLPPRERNAGVVFQDVLLMPKTSALDNVAFAARANGASRGEARAHARQLLRQVGIEHRAHARASELSGGEAQRVALARALARRPEMLLLDEAFSSLDVRARAEIRTLIRTELERFGGPAIVVTHDPVDAAVLGTHVAVVEEGRVTQTGTLEEIRADPKSRYAAEFAGVNVFAGVLDAAEHGVARLRTADGEVIVQAAAAGRAYGVLRPSDVALFVAQPDTSARNVLRGRVESISIEADRARVRIASAPPIAADVTLGSMERLGIRPGTEVWAAFKATEVRVIPGT